MIRFFIENIFWFQLASLVISAILGAFIIYFLIKIEFFYKHRYLLERFKAGKIIKRRKIKALKRIEERLRKADPDNLKMAIIEADKVLDEILKMSGFKGETMGERLNNLTPAQLPNLAEIKKAHYIRNKIVHEPDFTISFKETQEIINIYKRAYKEFGIE